ncbi:uncharacterized protein LOC100186127 [Ciona intestinalis]
MEFNISNTTTFPSLEESVLNDYIVRTAYRVVSLLFIVADFYLVLALVTYELTLNKNKTRGGRPLRALCILAATISLLHQILQQFLLEYAGKSDTACMVTMCLKSTVFNLQVTTTYVFLWKRQRMSYANPALRHLRTKFMEILTWVVMVLLLVNPLIMLGFQFKGKLYEAQESKCIVLKQPTVEQIPYIAVAFSYSFIEITLIYLYLTPLYKNRSNRQSAVSSNAAYLAKSYASNSEVISKRLYTSNNSSPLSAHKDLEITKPPPKESKLQARARLESRMKHWLCLGLVCMVSDAISATIIAVFLIIQTPGSVISISFLWHDISMFINVVCLVACFSKYRTMLFPFMPFLVK